MRKPVAESTEVSRRRRDADTEGRTVLKEVVPGEEANFVCSCKGLSEGLEKTSVSEDISVNQLNAWVNLCVVTPKYKTIPQSEIDMHQEYAKDPNGTVR